MKDYGFAELNILETPLTPVEPQIFITPLEATVPFITTFPTESGVPPLVVLTADKWRVGDPIDQPDDRENYPNWPIVRSRYWQSRPVASGEFSAQNLGRMALGYPPKARIIGRIRSTGEEVELLVSKELHHISGRTGDRPHAIENLIELWPWEHEQIDPSRYLDYDFMRFK